MKLNRMALAVLLTTPLTMVAHADLFGQSTTGLGLTVTPMIGYQWFDKDTPKEIKVPGSQTNAAFAPYGEGIRPYSDVLGAIALGYELTPWLSIEAQYNETNNDASIHTKNGIGIPNPATGAVTPGTLNARVRSLEGNFLINSDLITHDYDSKFKPYLLIGAGGQEIKASDKGVNVKSSDTIGNLGLGAFYRINDALALRGEGRLVDNFDHQLMDWKVLAGLQITIGGHKRPYMAPAPAPVPEPLPQPLPPQPQPVKPVETDELKLELRVFFDTNKSIIKKQYQPEIAKVADKMKDFPNANAEIRGYTDSTGPKKLNDRLSQARADAVKNSLTKDYGIDAARLTAKGYSWNDPVASNKTKEGRALNRRVVAVIAGSRTVAQ